MALADQFMEYIGSASLSATSASLTLSFRPAQFLTIVAFLIPTVTDNVNLTFNSDVTSGNYSYHYLSFAAAGATLVVDANAANVASARIGPSTSATTGRFVWIQLVNWAGLNKPGVVRGYDRMAGVATNPTLWWGSIEYSGVNPINSLTFSTTANNLAANSFVRVHGGEMP